MEETQKPPSETLEAPEATALDVEFLPLIVIHKVHRNLNSSQVELVPQNYYVREPTPEPEPEITGEMEVEVPAPKVVYAAPLPALREKSNWWDFDNPTYAFNNPSIRSRLELLMTHRIVYVTDRRYMVRLQEKIKDNFMMCLQKRMKMRAAEEIEREKSLLLEGRITYEEAPQELKKHPVCRINHIAQRIMRHKRAKMKAMDKTWAYKTHLRRIRMMEKVLKNSITEKVSDRYLESSQTSSICVVHATSSEDIENGMMFTKEDYNTLKHEHPLVKLLREVDVVNEMYDLADKIIGCTKVEVKSEFSVGKGLEIKALIIYKHILPFQNSEKELKEPPDIRLQ